MGVGIGLGLAEFPFTGTDGFWKWIGLLEESGVDSVWQIDRMASSQPFLECMTMLAAVAGATKRLKFGMNVASAGIRDPLLLARECATIDFLSNGRLLPAFGIGSIAGGAWDATGRPTRRRGKRTNEALELIHRLWTEDSVTFEGEFFQYKNVCIAPKPVQRRIPFWLGGSSPAAIRRTARYGTGWLAGLETPERIAPVIAGIKQAAVEAGRRIDDDHFGAGFPFRFGHWDDPVVRQASLAFEARSKRDARDYLAVGNAQDIIEHLRGFVAAGAYKFVLRPIAAGDADIMAQTRMLIDEVLPEVYGDAFEASARA